MTVTTNREAIYTALYTLLSGITYVDNNGQTVPLKTFSRRLQHWNKANVAYPLPALFLAQGNERHEVPVKGLGNVIYMTPKVYLYVSSPDPVTPGTVLNPILDQLQGLFPTGTRTDYATGKQTLGGLVQHAQILGELLTYEGTLGDLEVAIVPLELKLVS